MKIYNTLTHSVCDFIPNKEGHVKMYTCGPTVYHFAHIGNLRTYITEDILEKTLEYIGYDVDRVMNITDVGHLSSDSDSGEDKMLKGAKREHKSVMDIAKFYTEAFLADCNELNIKIPKKLIPATTCIDEYIKIIEGLLDKEFAYISGGNVYFDTSKLDDYYVLTNHKEDEMVVGVREGVLADLNKRNQNDFVLWFTKSKFDSQELKWDSPFGLGYPGWHIECSGISLKYLGEFLDIHCGGVDNIFPHHTNEIAQSESYIGHKWCNFWVHSEHLNDETGKMSKSKGEFLTVSLLKEKGYNPLAYRLFCLQSHYRKTLLFSYDVLNQVQSVYDKLIRRIQNISEDGSVSMDAVAAYKEKFIECITNDMNTASSLTVLYDVLKDKNINGSTKLYLVKDFDKVLSLNLITNNSVVSNELDCYIEEMIARRNEAKKNKDFCLADAIRNELLDKGIVLMDTREGTKYELR